MASEVNTGAGTSPLSVLIVGAGIGGLAAAIALRQQGHNVEVLCFALVMLLRNSEGSTDVRAVPVCQRNWCCYSFDS